MLKRKLLGHKKFYHDKDTGFAFYGRMSKLGDISVLAFSPDDQNVRQYMIDFASLVAMQNFIDAEPTRVIGKFIMTTNVPTVVRRFVEDDQMTIIRTVDSKFVKSAVVVKTTAFDNGNSSAIYFKRIAWNAQTKSIIGIDTLALPLKGVEAFMAYIKKLFKNIDLELELKEESDGSN